MKRWIWLLLLLVPFIATAEDRDYALCVLCHGSDVNGNRAIYAPKLAGMDRWYLENQLRAFRSGTRGRHALDVGGSEMRTVALSLSEAQLKKALDVVVKAKSQRPTPTVVGDAVRGRTLYAACAGCHGEWGVGNELLRAPRLAGGNDWYWVQQLVNYRNEVRGSLPGDILGEQMRAAALALPDEQAVNDVVAFINTLPSTEGR